MPEVKRKILISPLNWGFGHAGRMIPVALALKRMGHDIVVGIDDTLVPAMKIELPGIPVIAIKGVRVRYSRFIPQYAAVLLQTPKILASAIREHTSLRRVIAEVNPDIIISDNRFGFFNKSAFCVYITHMLRIPFPKPFRFLEPAGVLFHRLIIRRYSMCLVPDMPGETNLSGKLSHNVSNTVSPLFMGILSRFSTEEDSPISPEIKKPYTCLILSGPEPQRTILFRKAAEAAVKNRKRLVVLSVTPLKSELNENNLITIKVNQPSAVLRHYITNCERVICRSGYTALMELISLRKGAIIVPTPGQTEQEYLGDYMHGRFGFVTVRQHLLSEDSFKIPLTSTEGSYSAFDTAGLPDEALKEMLQQHQQRNGH